MYFLVDIIAVLFVLGLTLYGLRAGFFNSTVDALLVLVCVAGAGILAYIVPVLLLPNWIIELQGVLVRLFGNSKISGGQPILETVCYYISLGLIVIIFFIAFYIILNFIRKFIGKLIGKLNGLIVFGFLDKLLGFIVNFAFSAGLVLVLMAVFHTLAVSGVYSYGDEVLRASEVLSFFHEINPLNSLFESIIKPIAVA